MTTLYTIELKHPDGRPSLWAMARPQGWRPEFGGQLSAYPENAGRFDELQVSEWLAASSAVGNGCRAEIRVAQGQRAAA